jgi:subtilisin family serine protease
MIRINGWNKPIITFGIAALAILLIISIAGAAQPKKTEFINGYEVASGEVLVKFKVADQKGIDQVVIEEDVDEKENVGSTHVMRFHSRSKNVDKLIKGFSKRPDVLYAEPNYILRTTATPIDTYFNLLWGMKNTGQNILGVTGTSGADISATSAWDITTGNKNNVVAVIDTGIDYNHPDLAANIWSAPTNFTVTIGGISITCLAGTHGFNAISHTCDPMDDHGHGTHVSGTIGAVGNNGIGVVGVNWNASIMGAKFLDNTGSGYLSDAIEAIQFVNQVKLGGNANVRVLSNSWGGGGYSLALLDEINSANENNMLFVAAAGNDGSDNDGTLSYPSGYESSNVVAVAATDNKDNLASFSNYGLTTVDLGAPGVNVASTSQGSYYWMSGTSMATPHVSGAAALILSKCDLNTAQLKDIILKNVDPIPSLFGKTVTGGRLNVYKAILACSTPPAPDFSLSATPTQTVVQGASTSYAVSITGSGGFNGSVTLNTSGLPTGAIASFSTNPATASSTMTVTTSTTTPTGSYTLTIKGISGALTHTTTVALKITGIPDFSLSASPSSLSIVQGASKNSTITVGAQYGFTGIVDLTVSGITNATVSISPSSVTNSGNSTLTVNSQTAAPGNYLLTVKGTNGTQIHTTTVTVTITSPSVSDFSLSASPTSRTVYRGSSTSYNVAITRSGFTRSVSLSVSGLPSGATGSFSPTTTTGTSSKLSIKTTRSSTPTGVYLLTIKGTSGSLIKTTNVTLTVTR